MRRNVHAEIEPAQESANTGRASSSSAGADVDLRSIHAGKRPLEKGGGDDMVCGFHVCVYVNDCEGEYIDEVT